MSRIGTSGYWRKTEKGWRYNFDGHDISDEFWNLSLDVACSNTADVSPTALVVWQCVMAHLSSWTDLRNLATTCRTLHCLLESELGWSYLIRTKFGNRLWRRYVRLIFQRPTEQKINLHTDIDTMQQTEVMRECAAIPFSFLFNRVSDYVTPVTRAVVRSYRYHLAAKNSQEIVYLPPSSYIFRQVVSFKNMRSERLTDAQRRKVPLSKLLYFYLVDWRRVPVVDFSMVFPPA